MNSYTLRPDTATLTSKGSRSPALSPSPTLSLLYIGSGSDQCHSPFSPSFFIPSFIPSFTPSLLFLSSHLRFHLHKKDLVGPRQHRQCQFGAARRRLLRVEVYQCSSLEVPRSARRLQFEERGEGRRGRRRPEEAGGRAWRVGWKAERERRMSAWNRGNV